MQPMNLGRRQALRGLRRTCRHLPPAQRLHIVGRFLTCPFLPVLREIPAGSRILEIGAGHGILSVLAALGGASAIVAIDPDPRKVLRSCRHPSVLFVAGFDEAIAGTFDVVAMIDVLYKVPLAEWDALLARVRERLVPGGTFLLKELDPERRVKALWNRAQETLASAAGLTLGRAFSYEDADRLRVRLDRAGLSEFRARDLGRGYCHAHVLYSTRRPAG